jgi:hypothetical protein
MWWEVEGRDNPASASKQLKVLSDSQPLTYLSPLPPFKLRSTHSIPPTSPVRTLPNVCHTRRRTRGFGALWGLSVRAIAMEGSAGTRAVMGTSKGQG